MRKPRAAPPAAAARAGERGAAPGRRLPVPVQPAGEMMFPLVRDLAGDGIPVTVTCRVLKLCRPQYYRWIAEPISDAELESDRASQRRGQATSLRHQGPVLEPHRRLGYRRAHEAPARRRRARDGRHPPRGGGRLHFAHRPRVPISRQEGAPNPGPPRAGRLDGPGRLRRRPRRNRIVLRPAAAQRLGPASLDHPQRAAHRHRDLDRTHLSPTPPTDRPRPPHPYRIRDDQPPRPPDPTCHLHARQSLTRSSTVCGKSREHLGSPHSPRGQGPIPAATTGAVISNQGRDPLARATWASPVAGPPPGS
jgi:hypothetical protein